MIGAILPSATFDALSALGDPDLDDYAIQPGTAGATTGGFGAFVEAGLAHTLGPSAEAPFPIDYDKLGEAQRLFAVYGTEILGALLLAALPQTYACGFGAGVLESHGGLTTDLTRRVRGTAGFLSAVMQRAVDDDGQRRMWDPLRGDGESTAADRRTMVGPPAELRPREVCVALRGYHHAIRTNLKQRVAAPDGVTGRERLILVDQSMVAINQEDLLGMLLTFTISVFEVLERFGLTWAADEQEAYLHLWDVVGWYLGIGTPSVRANLSEGVIPDDWIGLRPPSVTDTRALLDQIRSRQWKDPSTLMDQLDFERLQSGRLLTKALLDELSAAMPPTLSLLPLSIMRTFAPEVVQRRLNLGSPGIVLKTLSHFPRRRHVTSRFTEVRTPSPIAGRILRSLANEVTSRMSMRIINEGSMTIPGLDIRV